MDILDSHNLSQTLDTVFDNLVCAEKHEFALGLVLRNEKKMEIVGLPIHMETTLW